MALSFTQSELAMVAEGGPGTRGACPLRAARERGAARPMLSFCRTLLLTAIQNSALRSSGRKTLALATRVVDGPTVVA